MKEELGHGKGYDTCNCCKLSRFPTTTPEAQALPPRVLLTPLRYTLVFAATRHEPAGTLERKASCGIAPVQLRDDPSRLARTEDVFAT